MSLLGIDVGGSGCKAIAYSKDGKKIAKSSRSYSSFFISEHESEFDIIDIWNNVKNVIKEISQKVKEIGDYVEALCFSVPGEAVVFLDKDLNILTNTFTSFDPRGSEFLDKVASDIDPMEMYKKTGQPLDFIYPPLRLLWLKKYKKEVYKKMYKFLGWHEYFLLKLGADPVVDPSLASRYLIFDINKKTWIEEYLDYFGISKESLPILRKSGEIVGIVSKKMANDLELPNNVKIVVGGLDGSMSPLGGGLLSENIGTITSGSVESMSFVKKNIVLSEDLFYHAFPFFNHAYSNFMLTSAYTFSGGTIVKWFFKEIAKSNLTEDSYSKIYNKMSERPSNLITLPTFTGSQTYIRDFKLRGVIVGLSLNTNESEILKALLEGTCFYLKQNYEYLSNAGNFKVKEINALGGGSRSPQWLQLKADILNLKINTLNEEDTGCIAAAILAGIGLGIFKNFEDTLLNFIKVKNEYYPRNNYVQFYLEKYNFYKNLFNTLRDFQQKFYQLNINLYQSKDF